MRRSTLAALSLLGLLPIVVGAPPLAAAPEAVAAADPGPRLKLKSGQMVSGTVVGSVKIQGASMWKVETDFGELLVPRTAVSKQDAGTPPGADATFLARQIRVVRLAGEVQRRPGAAAPWEKVSFEDPYSKEPKLNAPNALVGPGDTVRTGPDGKIDLMLHKDIWVHIGPNSEVEIPAVRSAGSLSLLRGDIVNQVNGRPRGEVFRVKTPSTVLGVRGTFFSCHVGAREQVRVKEGSVQLSDGSLVDAGLQAIREPGESWQVSGLSAEGRVALEVEVIRFPVDRMALVLAGNYRVGGWGPNPGNKIVDASPLEVPSEIGGYRPFDIRVEAFLIDRREATRTEVRAYRRARAWSPPSKSPELADPSGDWAATDFSAEECSAYPRWCGKALPSDGQWEVAARGPSSHAFPWGDKIEDVHRKLRISPSTCLPQDGWPSLPPMGPDPATPDVSPFGVIGMVTDPPEYCSGPFRDAQYHPHLQAGGALCPSLTHKDRQAVPVVRGRAGSTRDRTAMEFGRSGFGIRCVVELK